MEHIEVKEPERENGGQGNFFAKKRLSFSFLKPINSLHTHVNTAITKMKAGIQS